MGKAPDEFGLIAELFAPLAAGYPGALGLTDDAAFIAAEPGYDTVATMDTMVAGVHFLPDDPPDLIARKLVRVNLSDLAAKGAEPRLLMLSAAFPRDVTGEWLRAFGAGLAADVAEFGVHLIGGDTVATPGPLTLTLTALGRVETGRGLTRAAGRADDVIWVSGTIGDGALGLCAIRGEVADDAQDFLAGRYRLPCPRVGLGRILPGLAHASMDISDGLVQDLGHLCRASGLAARIEAAKVPLSPAAASVVAGEPSRLAQVLTGGDDYELLFTASAASEADLRKISADIGVTLTAIGILASGEPGRVSVIAADGADMAVGAGGWRHF